MKKIFVLLLTICIITVGITPAFSDTVVSAETQKEFRAFFYDFFSDSSFLYEEGVTSSRLKKEIDAVITFAAKNGFTAIYTRTTTSGGAVYPSKYLPNVVQTLTEAETSFDALQYFVDAAHQSGIELYAVADIQTLQLNGVAKTPSHLAERFRAWTYSSDGEQVWDLGTVQTKEIICSYLGELAQNYAIDGVMLTNFWYPDEKVQDAYSYQRYGDHRDLSRFRLDNVTELLSAASLAVKAANAEIMFGAAVPEIWANVSSLASGSNTSGTASYFANFVDSLSWIKNEMIDFIVPMMEYPIGYSACDYLEVISWWSNAVEDTDVKLYSMNMADLVGESPLFEKKYEIVNEIQLNRNLLVDGHVLSDYHTLANKENEIMTVIEPLYETKAVFDMSVVLYVQDGFEITRPERNITVAYNNYYITGICDPNQPLTINGEPVEDIGSVGVFGVYVELAEGENHFTFRQGNVSRKIIITRDTTSGSGKTTKITQSSMFPRYDEIVREGEKITVSCVAPSGGTVTAQIFGKTIELEQLYPAADGIAATYSATIEANYSVGSKTSVSELKPVTYTLHYNGKTTEYESSGTVYYAGRNAKAAVRSIEPLGLGTIFEKPDSNSDVVGYVYTGTEEYITGSTGSFYILSMGGYIAKSGVVPVTGEVDLSSSIQSTQMTPGDRFETITLSTSRRSPFSASMTDDQLRVTIHNCTTAPKIDVSQSTLFSACNIEYGTDSVTYVFNQSSSKALWGYHISYLEDQTIITLKKPPKLSDNSDLPLKGITVVVDPGHGGEDPGALGPSGTLGPTESKLNIAVSAALKEELEALGATVYLTRTTDIRLDYEGRLGFSDRIKPDFFLSIHHNSVGENANGGSARGIAIYYHSPNSKVFANNLLNALADGTGRLKRQALYADYRVTRMYYAPSVLVEVGFMPNPEEYSQIMRKKEIQKEAKALAKGLLKTLREYKQ